MKIADAEMVERIVSPDLAEFDQSTMWTIDERAAQLRREVARDIVSASSRRVG